MISIVPNIEWITIIGWSIFISKQELKIIIDSLNEIRTKICTIKRKPDKDITDLDCYRYEVFKKQLKELNAKLC